MTIQSPRTQKIIATKIVFVPNVGFDLPDADLKFLRQEGEQPLPNCLKPGKRVTGTIGDPIVPICNYPVMTREEERRTFLRMNYLKFNAARLHEKLAPVRPSRNLLDDIERLLFEAEELRNQIVVRNLRLCLHVAKKHDHNPAELDEFFSTATWTMFRCIERFDASIEPRFAAYFGRTAELAIVNECWLAATPRRKSTVIYNSDSKAIKAATGKVESEYAEQLRERGTHLALERALSCAEGRGRRLLRDKYGLWGRKPRTHAELSVTVRKKHIAPLAAETKKTISDSTRFDDEAEDLLELALC